MNRVIVRMIHNNISLQVAAKFLPPRTPESVYLPGGRSVLRSWRKTALRRRYVEFGRFGKRIRMRQSKRLVVLLLLCFDSVRRFIVVIFIEFMNGWALNVLAVVSPCCYCCYWFSFVFYRFFSEAVYNRNVSVFHLYALGILIVYKSLLLWTKFINVCFGKKMMMLTKLYSKICIHLSIKFLLSVYVWQN